MSAGSMSRRVKTIGFSNPILKDLTLPNPCVTHLALRLTHTHTGTVPFTCKPWKTNVGSPGWKHIKLQSC